MLPYMVIESNKKNTPFPLSRGFRCCLTQIPKSSINLNWALVPNIVEQMSQLWSTADFRATKDVPKDEGDDVGFTYRHIPGHSPQYL